MKKLLVILALAAVGACVLSKLTNRARKADQTIDSVLASNDRFVDFGVVLHVVEMDLEHGQELTPGNPPVRILRTHRFGGMFDTLLRRWHGPSENPVVWQVSQDQEDLVVHRESMPAGVWMQGSMGSGKTTAGCMWLALRVIKHATHPLKGAGVTAPTDKRMEEIRKTLFGPKDKAGERNGGMWPRAWYGWREGDQVCTLVTGLQIDFRSAHLQSAALGSPIQGQNWAFALNDELQDYYELDGDLRMRGRSSWRGRYERFATVTPKDSSGYRTFRAKVESSRHWLARKVIGLRSPFIWPAYWEEQLEDMDPREAARKIYAEDVGPERQLYHTWSRTLSNGQPGNLRVIPFDAEDVTAEVLRPWGNNLAVLVGHDPGKLHDVSVLLKAYRFRGATRHVWFIVGEVTTNQTTTEEHVAALLEVLRSGYGCELLNRRGEVTKDGPRAFVRADPYSDSGRSDAQPDKSVYTVFRQAQLKILPASVIATATRNGIESKPGTVSKEGRLNMMRRLCCDSKQRRRLYVACDDRGQPVAKKVVESFERSQRDEIGRAEMEKGPNDLSHWTAAPGYALWELEKPRVLNDNDQDDQREAA